MDPQPSLKSYRPTLFPCVVEVKYQPSSSTRIIRSSVPSKNSQSHSPLFKWSHLFFKEKENRESDNYLKKDRPPKVLNWGAVILCKTL